MTELEKALEEAIEFAITGVDDRDIRIEIQNAVRHGFKAGFQAKKMKQTEEVKALIKIVDKIGVGNCIRSYSEKVCSCLRCKALKPFEKESGEW